jgi:hypothetical protein
MIFTKAINERTSGRYVATLVDQDGALVGASALSTARFSLFASVSHSIVNGRNNVDMLDPANGWTFYDSLQSAVIDGQTVTFNMAWNMAPADASILDDTLATEGHVAELQFTWAAGAKGKTHRFKLNVANFVTIS